MPFGPIALFVANLDRSDKTSFISPERGGTPYMKGVGMLGGNFELNP